MDLPMEHPKGFDDDDEFGEPSSSSAAGMVFLINGDGSPSDDSTSDGDSPMAARREKVDSDMSFSPTSKAKTPTVRELARQLAEARRQLEDRVREVARMEESGRLQEMLIRELEKRPEAREAQAYATDLIAQQIRMYSMKESDLREQVESLREQKQQEREEMTARLHVLEGACHTVEGERNEARAHVRSLEARLKELLLEGASTKLNVSFKAEVEQSAGVMSMQSPLAMRDPDTDVAKECAVKIQNSYMEVDSAATAWRASLVSDLGDNLSSSAGPSRASTPGTGLRSAAQAPQGHVGPPEPGRRSVVRAQNTNAVIRPPPTIPNGITENFPAMDVADCATLELSSLDAPTTKTGELASTWLTSEPAIVPPRMSKKELFKGLDKKSDRRTAVRPAEDGEEGEKKPAQKNVFADADAMKAKVRQNLSKPQYNVKDFYKEKGWSVELASSYVFEMVTLGVIAVNAVWISVDTDYNHAEVLLDAEPQFQIAENLFCAYFSFEWIVRFSAFKYKRNCFRDYWFIFDSILVGTMVLETWVMNAIILAAGGAASGAGNSSVMRVARLLRLTRMTRMARLLRAMPELMILIKGMIAATRSVVFTLVLLTVVLYVFAIAFTQLAADARSEVVREKYFADVATSMFSLLMYGALMDSVVVMAGDLAEESFYFVALFFLVVLLASLTVMNMLIGVLCEVVSAVAITEKEEMLVSYVNGRLSDVVSLLDKDGSMSITRSEFMALLSQEEAVKCLGEVGVDVVGLVDLTEEIFASEDHELSFPDFMEVVLQLRGSNVATVRDMVNLRKNIRDELLDMKTKIDEMIACASGPRNRPLALPPPDTTSALRTTKGKV